ncbi:hypothetical protein M378DRAFT_6630 [Amanita muscaria Koide BX008]|uniref:Uncharacterized protein n=1 Tax=Amanita muscaria (strain Koide BX008) TaxID=946122 RepID=A0A0C2T483_AMAMK|nr:hypothetical protein M378DRAFT_6630 [Amanita muscaria Koide BX008]
MPPLPSRKTLEAMKRVDLQKLCKDYGVKANLKSEALIDLLLDTQSAAVSRHSTATSNPPPKPPTSRTSVSTRQSSRAGPSRVTSMIIHDVDDEEGQSRKPSHADAKNPPDNTNLSRLPEIPQQQRRPTFTVPAINRTRKAKELQRRLGVGKPVAAGGPGPRTITRSTTLSRGRQTRLSKPFKAEVTIPEEESIPEPPLETTAQENEGGITTTDVSEVNASAESSSSLASLAAIDEHVANALRPLHEQLQALRTELGQMHALNAEVAQLKVEVERLKSHNAMMQDEDPTTPQRENPLPKKPHGPGGLGIPSTVKIPNNQALVSDAASRPQITLGKRARQLSISNLEEPADQGEFMEREDGAPALKKAKTSLYPNHDLTTSDYDNHMQLRKMTPPGFTVFRESNEPPETVARLSDYITMPSPPGTTSPPEYTRQEATNGPENRNPSTSSFAPMPSTPEPQLDSHQQSVFHLPALSFFERPRSPTPGSCGTGRETENGIGSLDKQRVDMLRQFGLRPLSRPESRVPSTINPTILTTGKESDVPTTSNDIAAGLGLRAISSSVSSIPLDPNEAPPMRVTMYGTELDGDTRFGDFGVDGVATGFWNGGRF